jgi:hypothetical protein
MTRPSRGYLVFLTCGVLCALGALGGTARAEDPQPAAPAEHKFTGDKPAYFISGGVADNAFWTLGTTLPAGVTLSVGVSIDYNSNGLPGPTGMPTADKFGFQGLIYGAYYFYNKFPVGIALEAAVVAPLSPGAFDFTVIQPGIGIFYAPFPAPIVLGSGLDLAITAVKNGPTTVKTVTPGLRIVYVF